jgi:hypothetical protein
MPARYTREQAIAAFWNRVKVDGPDECWPWQGSINPDGYGITSWAGKTINAHRLAFFFSGGVLTEGMCACHTCDNPACCNPTHLFAGTHKENMADRDKKGRQAKGVQMKRGMLTDDKVLALRNERNQGMTLRALADKYGICKHAAWEVAKGVTWKHLPKKS